MTFGGSRDVRVTAHELLPASMHTRAVVKMKISFHVRSVTRAVNVLQIYTLPDLPSSVHQPYPGHRYSQ